MLWHFVVLFTAAQGNKDGMISLFFIFIFLQMVKVTQLLWAPQLGECELASPQASVPGSVSCSVVSDSLRPHGL